MEEFCRNIEHYSLHDSELRESSFNSNLNDPTYQELADLMVQGVSRKLHGTRYYHLKNRNDVLIKCVQMSKRVRNFRTSSNRLSIKKENLIIW